MLDAHNILVRLVVHNGMTPPSMEEMIGRNCPFISEVYFLNNLMDHFRGGKGKTTKKYNIRDVYRSYIKNNIKDHIQDHIIVNIKGKARTLSNFKEQIKEYIKKDFNIKDNIDEMI